MPPPNGVPNGERWLSALMGGQTAAQLSGILILGWLTLYQLPLVHNQLMDEMRQQRLANSTEEAALLNLIRSNQEVLGQHQRTLELILQEMRYTRRMREKADE